jgi:hypothetical protein
MPVFYTSGTLTNGSQNTKDIRLAIVTGINAAIAAGKTQFAVVDNGYVNGTSERSVITNTAGWAFMVFTHTTYSTNTNVYMVSGQSYNAGTHVLTNTGFGNTTGLSNSTGYSGVTLNPSTAIFSPGSTNSGQEPHQYGQAYSATTTQTDWRMTVGDDYFIFSIKDGTTSKGKTIYVGNITSLVGNTSITDSNPAVFASNYINNFSEVQIINSVNNNSVNINHSARLIVDSNFTGLPSSIGTADIYSVNPTLTSLGEVFVVRGNTTLSTMTNSNAYGWLRGKLKDVLYSDDGTSVWGDTTIVAGRTYYYAGGVSNVVSNTTTNTLAMWVATN